MINHHQFLTLADTVSRIGAHNVGFSNEEIGLTKANLATRADGYLIIWIGWLFYRHTYFKYIHSVHHYDRPGNHRKIPGSIQQICQDGIVDLDKRLKHKFAFRVHRIEQIISELGGNVPPNRQSHYYIAFIQNGSGEKTVGSFTFPIVKNTLLVIPKRVNNYSKYL